MKKIRKILRRFTKFIASIVVLIIIVGLVYRYFIYEPNQPLGKLVDIGGYKLHINIAGEKSNKPTLVIEGGSGMATEYYHWLSEGLKDNIRVVRYDRAGIGYSETNNTSRDSKTIANELHLLLEKAGEFPPYIMAGHSLGGSYIREFTKLYPDEVVALFLLDATHPNRVEKITTIPKESSFKFKLMVWMYDFQGILANLGTMLLYDKLFGPIPIRTMDGLPDEINNRTVDFLKSGKYIKTMGREMKQYHNTLKQAGEFTDFDSLPIRIFPAAIKKIPDEDYKKYLERGIDLRKNQLISRELQDDYLNLSTNTKLIEINGDHTSIFTKKENADVICKEIISLVNNQ